MENWGCCSPLIAAVPDERWWWTGSRLAAMPARAGFFFVNGRAHLAIAAHWSAQKCDRSRQKIIAKTRKGGLH
jgi:hypothetical protein